MRCVVVPDKLRRGAFTRLEFACEGCGAQFEPSSRNTGAKRQRFCGLQCFARKRFGVRQ